MPRPIAWLPRLSEIRRSVDRSVRSHFGRRELELMFKIRPKTAGKLLDLVATDGIGTSHLVSRDALLVFLDEIRETDDVSSVLEVRRARRAGLTRVKARHLSVREVPHIPAAAIPDHITLERGRVTIAFASGEQLIQSFLTLLAVIDYDPLEFERSFEARSPERESVEAREKRFFDSEIGRMDRELELRA